VEKREKEKREKRIRRTPEEAQELILDAAERSLGKEGPAALRLQDVAKAAGVSHPTVLHHFGSREGLVRALNLRAMQRLKTGLMAGMSDDSTARDGVARSFAAFRGGVAESLVWLLQSDALPPPGQFPMTDELTASLHALRQRYAQPGHEPDIVDTRHVVELIAVASMGDALLGPRLRGGAQSSPAFEQFLSDLVAMYLTAKA